MVSLKVLETALNQVEKIRDHVLTFNAGGTRVSLRALRSEEETEVQRYAQIAFEGTGDEPDQAHMADFMDRLRHGSLGFSVVRLGDLDLQFRDPPLDLAVGHEGLRRLCFLSQDCQCHQLAAE